MTVLAFVYVSAEKNILVTKRKERKRERDNIRQEGITYQYNSHIEEIQIDIGQVKNIWLGVSLCCNTRSEKRKKKIESELLIDR